MTRASALATAAAGAALLAAAPPPAAAITTLSAPATAVDPLAPLLALLALVAWTLLAWLLVVALASTAARLPGLPGRVGEWVARRIAPVGVRRLVEVTLGLTVAAGGLGASPASAGSDLPPLPPPSAVSLDWPDANTTPIPAPSTAPVPPVSVAPSLDWHPQVAVVVQAGDSLWSVAADHLPAGASNAQIAQSWPTWWSANRAAVGPDPDLIHPGLPLVQPTTTY